MSREDVHYRVVNGLSASRLVLSPAYLWLATDPTRPVRQWSVFFLVVILASDWLDGALARHWKVTSRLGYVLDGLGDRASYIAFLFAFWNAVHLDVTLMYLLIFRDVALYAARSFSATWEKFAESTRWLTKSYAALYKLGLLLGLLVLYEPLVRAAHYAAPWVAPAWVRQYFVVFVVYSYLTLALLVRKYWQHTPTGSQA